VEVTAVSLTGEEGIRVTELLAAMVTAERKEPRKSLYYSEPDYSMTQDKLEAHPAAKDIFDILALIPSVQVLRTGNPFEVPYFFIMGQHSSLGPPPPPVVLIDNIPVEIQFLNLINVNDIAQIDILKNANASIYGVRGAGGAISIFTKGGGYGTASNASQPPHIKTLMLLGYQQPAEFYASETTIHWQPVVQSDSLGVASFEFYADDENSSYTVTIEGLADDGSIIRYQSAL
jgi:TonB-dependent SusC/RagA subfamily outer membrane receptor